MTDVIKMKQGMSYSSKEKTIILNVFKYFRLNYPNLCVTEVVRRTAKATGCSEKSVFQFRKEESSPEGFREPSKTKIRKNININSRDVKYGNHIRQRIRNIIFDLKCRNILPSLNTILKEVNADVDLPNFSLMTLRRLMFDMGYYYEKNGNKSILTEKSTKKENKSNVTPSKQNHKHISSNINICVSTNRPEISNIQNYSVYSDTQPNNNYSSLTYHNNTNHPNQFASSNVSLSNPQNLPVNITHRHDMSSVPHQVPVLHSLSREPYAKEEAVRNWSYSKILDPSNL